MNSRLKMIAPLFASTLLIVAFQNCGGSYESADQLSRIEDDRVAIDLENNTDLGTETGLGTEADNLENEGLDSDDICSKSPEIGDQCKNGAIYAGVFRDKKIMVTPSGCKFESNSVGCDGSEDRSGRRWHGLDNSALNDLSTVLEIAEVENIENANEPSLLSGMVNTPLIVNDPVSNESSAAHFCHNMVFGGFSDWFLPSKSELTYLYCKADVENHNPLYPLEDPNCTDSGGKTSELKGFHDRYANGYYWSSTEGPFVEGSDSRVFVMKFGESDISPSSAPSGWSFAAPKSFLVSVRCIRQSL